MTNNTVLRVIIAGFGWFGKMHFRTWSDMKNVKVVGICDPDPQAFDLLYTAPQDHFHRDVQHRTEPSWANVPRANCLEDLLRSIEADVVDVVAPETQHFQIASQALASGCSIIIEKPFAMSYDQARYLEITAKEVGRNMYPAHVLRFDARYVSAYETLSAQQERPNHISFQRHFQTSALQVYGRVDPIFGACIHDIDLAIWAHGKAPSRVLGFRTNTDSGVLRSVGGIMQWAGGYTAVLQNHWGLPSETPSGFLFETSFYSESQYIQIRNQPVLEIVGKMGVEWPEMFFWPYLGGSAGGALAAELAHFAHCELSGAGGSFRVPVVEAVEGIRTAEALVRSIAVGEWIEL